MMVTSQARAQIVVLAILLFGAASALGQETWQWTIESVDSSSTTFTWLAADKLGNVHASYSTDRELKYAFRPAGQHKWFTMTVNSSVGFNRIAVDDDGNPHMCFTGADAVHYAVLTQHRWSIQQIAPNSGHDLGYSCGIGVAPDGTPSVTWYHLLNADRSKYMHFKYAVFKGGAWFVRTVDFEAQTGKWNDVAVDRRGNPHISYDSFVLGKAKYASTDGQNWTVEAVATRGRSLAAGYHPGLGNSIFVDQHNNPHIAYEDGESLYYAQRQAGRWTIEKVDSVGEQAQWRGYRTSLVVDGHGSPHLCYDDTGAVKHAYRVGNQWHIQQLVGAGPEVWHYCSIAVDSSDTLYVSFSAPADGSLKVAVGHPTHNPKTAGK